MLSIYQPIKVMITILSISDSDKHFKSAVEEYQKRLGKDVTIHDLKPFKGDNRELVIDKDTENIIAMLDKKFDGFYKILLIKEGDILDTQSINNIMKDNPKIVFIIGGPYGLSEERLGKIINKKISFGKITLPHGLAKLVLIEQIYRCKMIASGRNYHY